MDIHALSMLLIEKAGEYLETLEQKETDGFKVRDLRLQIEIIQEVIELRRSEKLRNGLYSGMSVLMRKIKINERTLKTRFCTLCHCYFDNSWNCTFFHYATIIWAKENKSLMSLLAEKMAVDIRLK